MVHVPITNDALVKLIVPAPATAVTDPPQLLTTLGVGATTRLAGNVSVKLLLMATTFPLVMLKVIVEMPFTAMVVGLKLLVMEGGCKIRMPALAVPPLDAASPEELAV